MSKEPELSLYCILDSASAPVSLNRRKETGVFYYHLPIPLKEQLIIYCEGELETPETEYSITVTYKDDSIELGKISNSKRCLLWKYSENAVPESMLSEKENGIAKLLVEKMEVPVNEDALLANSEPEIKDINENTPQITEEAENTPDRPQKKRKNSLNKNEKTPTGQVMKKQKIQKIPTRMRTGVDSCEKKAKGSSPLTESSVKNINNKVGKGKKKSLSESELEQSEKQEKVGKRFKQETIDKRFKCKNSVDGSTEKIDKRFKKKDLGDDLQEKVDKRFKKKDSIDGVPVKLDKRFKRKESVDDKTEAGTSENVSDKEANKNLTQRSYAEQNLNDSKTENSEADRKQSSKIVKRKSEMKKNTETPEDSEAKSTRTRKTKKGKLNESVATDDDESCTSTETMKTDIDKENVQIDSNIPKTENSENLQKISEKDKKPTKPLTVSATGTAATCKDLTLRAFDRPSGRWGHSLCFVNRNLSVLIGGQGEKQQISKDSVWALDCETRRWKDPETKADGQKPEYRLGHTANYDPLVRCIYVYGGSKNTRWFHDVHILDIEEWKWQLVKVNGKAPTRAYHSATLYRHELWIFGGVYPRPDPQPDGCSNEVHIFSPIMESWYSPIVSGEKPIPRSGHSATLINDQLVVFGGWDAPISYNDLHVLDMSIVEWSQPKVIGTPPSPRSWHASCALSRNRLLIHGGYNGDFALDDTHIFNLDTATWMQIYVESEPTARVGHKALCMPYRHDNEEQDEVIIFGGGDNDGAYFDDLFNIFVPFEPATVS